MKSGLGIQISKLPQVNALSCQGWEAVARIKIEPLIQDDKWWPHKDLVSFGTSHHSSLKCCVGEAVSASHLEWKSVCTDEDCAGAWPLVFYLNGRQSQTYLTWWNSMFSPYLLKTHLQFFQLFLPTADGVALRLLCLEWSPGFESRLQGASNTQQPCGRLAHHQGFPRIIWVWVLAVLGLRQWLTKPKTVPFWPITKQVPLHRWGCGDHEKQSDFHVQSLKKNWNFLSHPTPGPGVFFLDLGILCRCDGQAYDLSNSSCQHNGFRQPCQPCGLLSLKLERPAVSIYTLSVFAYSYFRPWVPGNFTLFQFTFCTRACICSD